MLLWLTACHHPLELADDDSFPELLSELDFENAPGVVPFEPVWPLWSNGLEKRRWVYVPAGEVVDTSSEPWRWPAGSMLFKTFLLDGAPIETRILWKPVEEEEDDEWEYFGYQWAGDDASILELNRPVPVADGRHEIPSELDCKSCHEPAGGPIGLNPWQLDDAALASLGSRLDPLPERRLVEGPDPATTDILGYWVGNCTSCHDGELGDQHSFDLSPGVALDNTLGIETDSGATASGLRIAPGDPEQSILFLAVSGEHDNEEIKSMPPTGVQQRDSAHIEALRSWITSL